MITEGTEIVTIGRFGQKCANFKSGGKHFSMPVWSAKTYVATHTQRGDFKWFLVSCHGRTIASRYPSKKFIEEVKSKHSNFAHGITHLTKVKNTLDI